MENNLTSAEKIFSRISAKDVKAGEFVWGEPDLAYMHDVLGPLTIETMKKINGEKVNFKGKVVVVNDHIYPPKDSASANNIRNMSDFAKKEGWDIVPYGEGIEHTLLIENNIIREGMLVVGTDSHTVTAGAAGAMGVGLGSTDMAALLSIGKIWFKVPETILIRVTGRKKRYIAGKDLILKAMSILGTNGANYKSIEFRIERECEMNRDDDLSIANMTVEAGAKTSIIFNEGHSVKNTWLKSDEYSNLKVMKIDLSNIDPLISFPFSPGNVAKAEEYAGTRIDQVYIGNCSNGTISDLREAAEMLKGNTVKDYVKMIVVPATRKIYKEAIKEGIIDIFLDAGATVAPPTCGACAGLHMGVLAKGEVCITNINRNFRGRMGDPESKVFISNSYVAAASAVEGRITVPGE
ncbi:aconitase/3-isopropylmalate dehydratase large subunit family protein [Oxyplasma meridianum]|uniref:Aconitase/3-isopropylmalate dehydratase large subunit family protein n=1 Tax=Oxyplasma meridianum TaxID=3073602 RepID=A0AAX4NDT1_9ARCH